LVSVTVTAKEPDLSSMWANTAAEAVVEQARQNPVPGFYLRQIADAQVPREPDSSAGALQYGAVAVFGGLVGAAVSQLVGVRDRRRAPHRHSATVSASG